MMSVVLVGIGGWGWVYVDALLDAAAQHGCRFVGAVDPYPQGCKRLGELRARGIAIYPTLQAFYAAAGTADLAVIASPPHCHVEHACTALRHGSHVLCEKPVACSLAGVGEIARARDAAKRRVAIGYQWSFSAAVRRLKRDVAEGRFGAAIRFRTLVQWPRGDEYYRRNSWAGRVTDDAGAPVLDSPLNNACAHFVHNALYVLGDEPDASAIPLAVQGELYRANRIENYDTAVMRCRMDGGAEMLFAVSHATAQRLGPRLEYEFERGAVRYDQEAAPRLVAQFDDGTTCDYGDPSAGGFAKKLWDTVHALRANVPLPCGAEAAGAHTACIVAVQQCVERIGEFPPDLLTRGETAGGAMTTVNGLEGHLEACYHSGRLPHELGVSWARPAIAVPVAPSARGDSSRPPDRRVPSVSISVPPTSSRRRPWCV